MHTTVSDTNGTSLHVPRLARETEPCASCGALLASDQRYCLSCGERRAGTRVPFPKPAPVTPPREHLKGSDPFRSRRGPGGLPDWALSALFGLAGAAALGLGILAGVLIAGGGDSPAATVAAATPTPIATAAPSATAAAPVPTPVVATFTADWPPGQKGWTVQLQTLPKDGTSPEAVATAKADATTRGAAGVGALDSDAFATLDGGNYVIYSTVASSKQDAEAALRGIEANFPDAKVVEVADQATETKPVTRSKAELQKAEKTQSPEDAQKNTRKAPPTVKSEGTPPPADDKAPGAGSDATEIG